MANPLYDRLVAAHATNDAPFLICDSGRVWSYRQFVQRAAQMAGALVAAGLRPGGRVVTHTGKSADALALYAGTLQAGGVYMPLNPAYKEAELAYFFEDAAPQVIVCDPVEADMVANLPAASRACVLTLSADDGTLRQEADRAETAFATVKRATDDLAALLYTSGTTGRSKGAMLSHENLLSNAEALLSLWQLSPDDTLLHALPIFHTHGLFVACNTALLAGARVRYMARFDVADIVAALPNSTVMMGVPTFYTRLLQAPGFGKETCRNMRLFISGSAPLLSETHDAFFAHTGHKILERYGMTEASIITSNPYDGARIPGTVGFALPDVAVAVVQDGKALPTGEIGMVTVRGPNVFQGYWQMPEKTREEMLPDGSFLTGDLGKLDAEGRLSIVGRAKDLVISGGYNIYPKEVEDVLNKVAGVVETAVFGVPDPDLGEIVVAAVVAEHTDVTDDVMQEAAAADLARFKQPRRYVFLDALPRNAMGKVQKTILRTSSGAAPQEV